MIMETKKRSGFPGPLETPQEKAHRETARQAAAEGFVLLKNEGMLPLPAGCPIALLGGGAGRTVKGGTGSGDVNEREIVSVWRGLENAGFPITSRAWLEDYDRRYQQARCDWRDALLRKCQGADQVLDFFHHYATNPFRFPDGRPITAEDVGGARTAVYVISRFAGEGFDRQLEPGDYYLTDAEKADLAAVCALCDEVAVLINTGAQIDLTEILAHQKVKAVVYMVQPGMEGGNAVADVLSGKQNFSGKLTDSWAQRYWDYPNAASFSHMNGDVQHERYTEDIYVGYRYFDTFGVTPLYSFGFGLSYTQFRIDFLRLTTDGKSVSVAVTVANTGAVAGKEVVQLYASFPQAQLPKEHRRLCAFAKTPELAPGETRQMTITFPVKALASFSEAHSAWVMEQGLYGLWIGNSLGSASPVCGLEVAADAVIERVARICPPQTPIDTLTPPDAAAFTAAWHAALAEGKAPIVALAPMAEEKRPCAPSPAARSAKELVGKLTDEELISICVGNVKRGQGSALGSAGVAVPGSAGETSNILEEKYQVPGIVMADGPAGLRLIKEYHVSRETGEILDVDFLSALEGGLFAPERRYADADAYYQYCTSFPVGALLAQTWNPAVLERVGAAVAEEMRTFGVSWWLAPGMNIHRNPLCGRNFEYFSEDPLVSGVSAAAITRGVQSVPGVGTTIKHFACNNQEDNRMGSDSILTQRALREIYIRGFEIAIKTAQPMCIMTSYNSINGVHAANCRDLCTQCARTEWGFEGVIMTDWTTTNAGGSDAWRCADVGNDLIMPGADSDFDSIRGALADGRLGRAALERCVERMLKVIFQTSGYRDAVSYSRQFEGLAPYIAVE